MPNKCSVVGCSTNYHSEKRNVVFKFPADEEERRLWIKALPNANFQWTSAMRICIEHWPENYPSRKARNGSLIPLEPPSVFQNVPTSCIPGSAPKARNENSFVTRNQHPDELDEFLDADRLNLHTCVHQLETQNDDIACRVNVVNYALSRKQGQAQLRVFRFT
jgi:hypothetical protein